MSYEQQVELGGTDDACAVCLMPLSGVPVTRVQHLAADFVACSPECVTAFYKDPDRYASAEEPEEE